MSFFSSLFNYFYNQFAYSGIPLYTLVGIFIVVSILSAYEFIVYRFVLHRALYNKAFNICISVIPFFISAIILCLQTNLVITLGTIGALAIIRFRTAVKDPVDMIFILWSIFVGITCGCQLFVVSVFTTILVTIVLMILNNVSLGMKSHILVIHTLSVDSISKIEKIVKDYADKYRIKSRNITDNGVNVVFEVNTKKANELTEEIAKLEYVKRFSLMEYEPDDIL